MSLIAKMGLTFALIAAGTIAATAKVSLGDVTRFGPRQVQRGDGDCSKPPTPPSERSLPLPTWLIGFTQPRSIVVIGIGGRDVGLAVPE